MYCPLVPSKTPLCSCLIVALTARVFDSYMYCSLVFSKISLHSCLIFALPARVIPSCSALFYVHQYETLKLLDGSIVCKDISLLHVLPFYVQLYLPSEIIAYRVTLPRKLLHCL